VRRLISYCIGLVLWLPGKLFAQHVIYSESINTRSAIRLQVIGRSENFYWAEKLQRQRSNLRRGNPPLSRLQGFALFDAKLNLLREEMPAYFPGTQKQWLMTGKNCLDQFLLTSSGGKTRLYCTRFYADAQTPAATRLIDSLPFTTDQSAFLLVRSEDHSKIIFVGFENTDEEFTRVHAILLDADWNILYHQVLSNTQFSQPCIQDEEIGFPAESFDNLPVKLANNGEWMMAAPSRISHNFSLFHACANGSDYYFREIPLSPYYKMEDIAMFIDNEKQEMSVGVLSGYRSTSLKCVQITHYSMLQGRFDFDTSYHFNTQSRDIRSKNLSHESFIAISGGGYMLLMEYGYPYEFNKPEIPFISNLDAAFLLANYRETDPEKTSVQPGYTLNHGLTPIHVVRNRGDLNLFYFPSVSKDSVWSGILDMEQHAESNNPDLSYLMIPDKNKLYIIYNSLEGSSDPMATTTTLNRLGQETGDGLVFWKMNKLLNFQLSRRFSAGEVSIPYMNNQDGFAIIRLQ
jgi:hypothetical protein